MSLFHFPFGMEPQYWVTHELITSAYEGHRKVGHPHNMYLMWAAEYGWLSVLGITLIGFSVLGRLFNIRSRLQRHALNSEHAHVVIALTASVCAAMVHAGVSAVLIAPASMLVGLAVGAIFWSVLNHDQSKMACDARRYSHHIRWFRCAAAFFIFAVLIFWYFQVVNYYHAMQVDEPWYIENVPQSKQPRFWFHGNFPRRSHLMPENTH